MIQIPKLIDNNFKEINTFHALKKPYADTVFLFRYFRFKKIIIQPEFIFLTKLNPETPKPEKELQQEKTIKERSDESNDVEKITKEISTDIKNSSCATFIFTLEYRPLIDIKENFSLGYLTKAQERLKIEEVPRTEKLITYPKSQTPEKIKELAPIEVFRSHDIIKNGASTPPPINSVDKKSSEMAKFPKLSPRIAPRIAPRIIPRTQEINIKPSTGVIQQISEKGNKHKENEINYHHIEPKNNLKFNEISISKKHKINKKTEKINTLIKSNTVAALHIEKPCTSDINTKLNPRISSPITVNLPEIKNNKNKIINAQNTESKNLPVKKTPEISVPKDGEIIKLHSPITIKNGSRKESSLSNTFNSNIGEFHLITKPLKKHEHTNSSETVISDNNLIGKNYKSPYELD